MEVLDLKIKPYKHNEYFNLYYVPTSEIINLVSSIEKNNSNFTNLLNTLPNVATESLHRDIIVNELYSTNQIEGIKSNKQEIVRSSREFKANPKGQENLIEDLEIKTQLDYANKKLMETLN